MGENIDRFLKIIDNFFSRRSYWNVKCLEFRDDMVDNPDKKRVVEIYTYKHKFNIFIMEGKEGSQGGVYFNCSRPLPGKDQWCCVGDIPYDYPLTKNGWFKLLGKMMEYEMDPKRTVKVNNINEECEKFGELASKLIQKDGETKLFKAMLIERIKEVVDEFIPENK